MSALSPDVDASVDRWMSGGWGSPWCAEFAAEQQVAAAIFAFRDPISSEIPAAAAGSVSGEAACRKSPYNYYSTVARNSKGIEQDLHVSGRTEARRE